MISLSHSPNSTSQQQKLALSLLLPWNWRHWQKGNGLELLKSALSEYHENAHISLFKNGRSALYAALKALGVSKGDEVIIQAYTCIVVPNSIIWAQAKPVYVDIDASYNLDPAKIEEAITPKTKALIIQHTFGYPAQMDKIVTLAKKHNLKIIEDCAHALGAKYKNKRVGTFGDIAIFSFGRDKMISSVSGGAAITKEPVLAKKLESTLLNQPHQSNREIRQNIVHPLLLPWMAKLIGKLRIGQLLIILSQKIGLLSKVYAKDECNGALPEYFVQPLPNAMALMALQQFLRIDENLKKRSEHAYAYQAFCAENGIPHQEVSINTQPSYLRYTIEYEEPNTLRQDFVRKGYILGNWYMQTVMPRPDSWSTIYYTPGSCPKSETLVKRNINLPTFPKFTSQQRIHLLKLLKSYYE